MQRPTLKKILGGVAAISLAATMVAAASPAATARRTSPVRFVGTTRDLRAIAAQDKHRLRGGGDAVDTDYIRTHQFEGDEPEGGEAVRQGEVAAPTATGNASVGGNGAGLVASWEGSNHFDSRYSGNGNQFQGEPPDQGLCADDTHVFEIVNSVIQVYTPTGIALLDGDPFFPGTEPVGITLAQFFGLPPEFVRPDGPFGPTSFDVSCQFDASTQRWFVSAEYLDQDSKTGDFTGGGGFRIAASTSADPLGSWNIWDVRTTNNGMGGTPDHKCSLGYCYGDYPQLGLDANGVYITTNEFSFFGGEFHGAQLYAYSKADLIAGVAAPGSATFENVFSDAVDFVAYTLQPVNTLPADYVSAHGGTMYFGMTQSPLVDGNATAVSLWRLPTPPRSTPRRRTSLVGDVGRDGGVHARCPRAAAGRPDAVPALREPSSVHRAIRSPSVRTAALGQRERQGVRRLAARRGRVPDDDHRGGGTGRRRVLQPRGQVAADRPARRCRVGGPAPVDDERPRNEREPGDLRRAG